MQYSLGLNYSAPELKTKYLGDFKGVDFTKAQLDVADFRASDMQNFIFDDGINQKRNGFNEVAKLPNRINGYWEFKDSYGKFHCIAHVGKEIYSIQYGSENTSSKIEKLEVTYRPPMHIPDGNSWYIDANDFKDRKSFGVIRGDRLYMFVGKFIVFGTWNDGVSWEIRLVRDNEDTYVPITTTNITPMDYKGKSTRASLEPINMMSTLRINKMYGSDFSDITSSVTLKDYSPENPGQAFATTFNKGFKHNGYLSESIKSIDFTASGFMPVTGLEESHIVKIPIIKDNQWHRSNYSEGSTFSDFEVSEDFRKLVPSFSVRYIYNTKESTLDFYVYLGAFDENVVFSFISTFTLAYKLDAENIDPIYKPQFRIYNIPEFNYPNDWDEEGYYFSSEYIKKEIRLDFEKGVLYIDRKCNNPNSFEPNMEMTFSTRNYRENEPYKKIDNCQIGIVFGYNGIEHLFASGNDDLPNIDWHTSEVFLKGGSKALPNTQNFTYFSDLSYSILGNTKTKIQSYIVLNDNTLGIIKEFTPHERSLFIREPYVSSAIDSSGNIVYSSNGSPYQKLYYKQYVSAIGEGCVSKYATSNLAGDKLFLSENGVYKIQLDFNNIQTHQRYAVEASRLINPRLEKYSKEKLSNATSIVYKNRYYLAMNDEEGTVYIADARFRNREGEEMNDALGYEWWVWKGIHARTWFLDMNGDLCFGDNEGRICKFNDTNNFSDNTYEKVLTNGVSYNADDKKFHLKNTYNVNNDANILLNSKLYESILTNEELKNPNNVDTTFYVSANLFYTMIRYYEDKEISIVNNGLELPCIIKNINYDNYSFQILVDGVYYLRKEKVENSIVVRKLGKEDIINVEESVAGGHTFQLGSVGLDENEQRIVAKIVFPFGNSITDALIEMKNNIKAVWVTPFMNMGTSDFAKTLRYITIVPEHILHGSAVIHILTKDNEPAIANVQGIDYNEYLDDLDLNSLSLEIKNFQKSFTKKLKIRNFNFMTIYLESDNDKNFAIENITLSYIISKRNRGIK